MPQQKTDYRELLNTWAIGLYTELDFINVRGLIWFPLCPYGCLLVGVNEENLTCA